MSLRKPYLDGLDPDAIRVKVVIDWMRHLGETFGTGGALKALRYYERRGWITAVTREQLAGYLRGLSLDEPQEKPGDVMPEKPLSSLSSGPFGAHARSLEYVAAIAGEDVDVAELSASMAERGIRPEGGTASPTTTDTVGSTADGNTSESDGYTFPRSDD